MFVDALDAQIYNDHHQRGHCYLSLSKVTSSTYYDDFFFQYRTSVLPFLSCTSVMRIFFLTRSKFNASHTTRAYILKIHLKTVGMLAFLTTVSLYD